MAIPDLRYAHISIKGGFIASKIIKTSNVPNLDTISAMDYALFQTANKYAMLLKNMKVENVLLDCEDVFQFISNYSLENAIFSTEIGKSRQKLGLIRLIIPQFSRKISNLIKEATEIKNADVVDVKHLISELFIK